MTQILGSMYSLAFSRGLIVHGILRANIKIRNSKISYQILMQCMILSEAMSQKGLLEF
ncbi:MAG: hypothetical protein UU05_C0055G0008 [Candidatus Curtissbacteria bacterium GW2011_GWA1_40_47]|nr:MAG: hypothetical protein UU05_C0055G0008 [Candidatus Curtissbacteria bacterium GW2011_GWA1_40_47]